MIDLLLVPVHGPARIVSVDAGAYREWADLIGGKWIQHVHTPVEGLVMLVDEEWLLTGRPANVGVSRVLYPGLIFGDVLLGSEVPGIDGWDVGSLTPEHLAAATVLLSLAAQTWDPET